MAKRVLAPLLVGMALLLVTLMATVAIQAQEEETTGDPGQGAALYAEYCLSCHGPQGEAVAGYEAFAANIHYSLEFVDRVDRGVAGTYMIGFGTEHGGPLTMAEIEDVAAFAGTWATGTFELPLDRVILPDQEGLTEEEARGAQLYTVNCAGCHGQDGEGRDKLANFPPIGQHVDVLALARRGVNGSAMPPFSQDYDGPLTNEDLNAIQAYVQSWEGVAPMTAIAAVEPKGIGELIVLVGLVGLGLAAFGVWTQRNR